MKVYPVTIGRDDCFIVAVFAKEQDARDDVARRLREWRDVASAGRPWPAGAYANSYAKYTEHEVEG